MSEHHRHWRRLLIVLAVSLPMSCAKKYASDCHYIKTCQATASGGTSTSDGDPGGSESNPEGGSQADAHGGSASTETGGSGTGGGGATGGSGGETGVSGGETAQSGAGGSAAEGGSPTNFGGSESSNQGGSSGGTNKAGARLCEVCHASSECGPDEVCIPDTAVGPSQGSGGSATAGQSAEASGGTAGETVGGTANAAQPTGRCYAQVKTVNGVAQACTDRPYTLKASAASTERQAVQYCTFSVSSCFAQQQTRTTPCAKGGEPDPSLCELEAGEADCFDFGDSGSHDYLCAMTCSGEMDCPLLTTCYKGGGLGVCLPPSVIEASSSSGNP